MLSTTLQLTPCRLHQPQQKEFQKRGSEKVREHYVGCGSMFQWVSEIDYGPCLR